jgi:Chaperone of endosialidase
MAQSHGSNPGGGGRGFGGGGFGGGHGGGFGHRSDIRLKEEIVPLGRLGNGIGLYRFRYRGNDRTAYVGVMAQEVQTIVPNAVSRGRDGYLRVDYDKLGLEFVTWHEWVARGSMRSATMQ